MQSDSTTAIGPRRQLLTCAVMCGVAAAIILAFHEKPYWPTLLSGLRLPYQAVVGLAVGGLYWISVTLSRKFAAGRNSARQMAENYRRLDLHGWNPFWIALAAGFGEELLFRGALQPVIGIWTTSLLFVLAHTRAYRFDGLSKRVLLQSFGLLAVSVVFGYIAKYVGLVSAIIIHTTMDVAGLYAIRRAHVPVTAAT